MDKLIQQTYTVSLAINALITSIIFFPWALPRETFSGFIGRQTEAGSKLAGYAAPIIDRFCFWEEEHCWITAWQEKEARRCFRD